MLSETDTFTMKPKTSGAEADTTNSLHVDPGEKFDLKIFVMITNFHISLSYFFFFSFCPFLPCFFEYISLFHPLPKKPNSHPNTQARTSRSLLGGTTLGTSPGTTHN